MMCRYYKVVNVKNFVFQIIYLFIINTSVHPVSAFLIGSFEDHRSCHI